MADPAVWPELMTVADLDSHTISRLDDRRREVQRSFTKEVVPELRRRGIQVLVRRAPEEPHPEPVPVDALSPLALVDFSDAFFPMEDDLAPLGTPLSDVEDDLAAMAAALDRHPPRRTHAGSWDKQSARAIGRRLLDEGLRKTGEVMQADPRWQRALAVLEVMHLLPMDPVTRVLRVASALTSLLHGPRGERFDHLARCVIDPELHPVLPVYRQALQQADHEAVDELIFRECIVEHHKPLLLSALGGADEEVHGPLLSEVRDTLSRMGLLAVGPGAFAATADGRAWAGLEPPLEPARMLVTSDLEVVVPPESMEPCERYHLERFTTCLQRDVANRHRLTRNDLASWLTHSDVASAIELLSAHAWGVPLNVTEALNAWSTDLQRVVVTPGS